MNDCSLNDGGALVIALYRAYGCGVEELGDSSHRARKAINLGLFRYTTPSVSGYSKTKCSAREFESRTIVLGLPCSPLMLCDVHGRIG